MSEPVDMYFNDFIKLNRGFDLPESKIAAGKYPIAASTAIKDYHNAFKVKAPCVTTGRSGSLGTVLYINENCWPLNTSLYVKDYKGNFPKYVYYFLQTMKLESFNCGAGVPTLNQNHLHKIKIRVHKKEEQPVIASILSAYDELIENNSRRIAILEQTTEQIYKEWFVRMRFPGYDNTEFEKGVPKDWTMQPLHDIAEITSSKRIFLSDYVKEGIPFYRGKEISMKSRNEAIEDLLYIDINKFIEIKSRFGGPSVGDILVTAVGTIGNVHLVNDNDGDFYFKDGNLIWLKNIGNPEISLFLFSMFNTKEFNNLLDLISIGSSQKALTIAHVKKIKILLPSNKLLKEYFSIIKPIHQKNEVLQLQNKNLKQTRDLLLPRLISGKLKVKESKKELETV